MPTFVVNPDVDYIAKGANATPAVTQADRDYASKYRTGLDRTPGSAIVAGVAGAGVDLVDTIASSVLPGVKRQDVNQSFLQAMDSPGLTRWTEENRGAIELGSGLAGTILADYVAGKILKPAGVAMQAIRGMPYARKIATLDAQYNRAKMVARLSGEEVALRGAMGADRFVGGALNTTPLGVTVDLNRGRATSNFYKASLARSTARNVLTEGVMAATLHTNDFLYDDELSHNLAWSAGGIAVGGVFDSLISTHALRKMANSETIRQMNRGAYDVTGYETKRLHAFDTVTKVLKTAGVDSNFDRGAWKGSGGITDYISSVMIQASENRVTRGVGEGAKALEGQRDKIATQLSAIAFEDMQKVTTRGVRGVGGTGFTMEAEGLGKTVTESLGREPTWALGLEEIGHVGDEITHADMDVQRKATLTEKRNTAQKLLDDGGTWKRTKNKDGTFTDKLTPLTSEEKSATQLVANELNFSLGLVPKVMLEPGEWAPLSHAAMVDKLELRPIVVEGGLGADNKAVWQAKPEKGKPRFAIASDGELFLPSGVKSINQLKAPEMIQMYVLGRKAVKHFAESGEVFTVPKNPNWFQLDMAEQIMKATGRTESVKYTGTLTRESAAVESFAQKVDAIRRKETNYRTVAKRGVMAEIDPAKVFEHKVMFNLPRLDNFTSGMQGLGDSGVDILLAGMKTGDDVRKLSHEEVVKALNDSRVIQGLTDEANATVKDLQGNSYRFMMNEAGEPMKPVIGYQRPMNPYEWTRDDLFVRQAMKQAVVRDELMGETADEFTKQITTLLANNPEAGMARRILELADDQHRSFIPGARHAAPQTWMGSLINSVTSSARRDVDSPVMQAASRVQELKARITQSMTKDIFDRAMGTSITEITSSRNARSLMLMNQLMTHGHGWYYADKLAEVTLPDSTKGFALVLDEKSALNQERFKKAYGRDLGKGERLLDPNGKPIVLDSLAAQVFQQTQAVHSLTRDAKNTLLRSQNLPEIAQKNWYFPPPNTKGKLVSFTFDMQNKVVPGMTLIADTANEMSRMKAALIQSPQWKDGFTLRGRDDIGQFMNLWDKAQMDWMAPNITAIQPQKSSFGLTGGNAYNPRAFEESLVTMRDSLVSHGDDIVDIMFDDVLKAAKVRSQVAKTETRVGEKGSEPSNIYDRFVQNLTGKNALNAKDSFFGEGYKWLETRINGALNSPPAEKAAAMTQTLNDWIRAAVPGKSTSGELFNKFSQELGNYMPFKSVHEMIEAETRQKMPSDIAGITSKLSWFEAASRLRWFESMHAVANIGSILANTPAVIRSLQPQVGESLAEAGLRNSSLGMLLHVGKEQPVTVPNTAKLLWQSQRDMWKSSGVPEIEAAKQLGERLGMFGQEVAEFNRAWGAIDSKAGWRGFMFGDEGRTADDLGGIFKGARAKVASSGGLDKWLGVLSDKSEDMSRQWGMQAGYRVAHSMGITDPHAMNNFAHEITNKLIANYDPKNRPEIFQGALGAPIGLFQSYIFNFYERMFRYVETSDPTRSLAAGAADTLQSLNPFGNKGSNALAVQMAMQGAVFGGSGVPGWNALNWAFFDKGQAKGEDPVDSMYTRFGQADADLLMNGVLSNLPKIFGAEGMSLYTRGDSSIRLPGSTWTTQNIAGMDIPLPNLPVVDTLSRVAKGIAAGIGAFSAQDDSIGTNHLAEIASNMITNRPIAGLIEVLGNESTPFNDKPAYDTSGDGQVVATSRSMSEKLYRVLGVRSMAHQKAIDNFYSSKTAQEEQSARRDILTSASRAAIRDNNYDALPGLFAKYVEQGGDPRYYSRWLKATSDSALNTRSERALQKALKDPTNRSNAYIGRLLDGQVDVDEDDKNTDDYGREEQIERLVNQGWETTPSPVDDSSGSPGEQGPGF